MQPFVAGQGHIQVDAFEPQDALAAGWQKNSFAAAVERAKARGGIRGRIQPVAPARSPARLVVS